MFNSLKSKQDAMLVNVDPHVSNVAVFYRNEWMKRMAARVKKGARVLDVGAGTAPYRNLFAHCHYFTHDFGQYEGQSKGPLPENWRYSSIDFKSDIKHIPVARNSFDIIICTEVLEHVPEPIAAIAEMSRILKVGGRLYLTAPLASGLHQEPYHFYGGFTPHFYKKFFSAHKLKITKITPTGGLFKHAAQELHRAGRTLWERKAIGWLTAIFLARLVPTFLAKFDDSISIPEFTMDYLIAAKKIK